MENKLDILRHSSAHILATAVLEMFPDAKFGIGPTIENGFYYDFDLPRTLIPEDLTILENKMRQIINKNHPFIREETEAKKAIELFEKLNQSYKVELIKDLQKEAGDQDIKVSIYKTDGFIDLCRGPHLESTKEIKPDAVKLLKIAGAYWRGDEKRPMLQRIYGTAFADKKELDAYQQKLVEAEKRDHRKLGKELELFLIDPMVGMGLVMWQPKGALLWRIMEEFWYQEHLKNGYQLVRTPHIGNRKLWETSGHWGFFSDNMYPVLEVGQSLTEAKESKKATAKEEYLLKPMNCPFHVTIYNSQIRSYRNLPIRWAECGTVYRYEKSGELSGLTRVRGFTQDDAHIVCSKNQVEKELKRVIDFIIFIFKSFGFKDYKVYLSLRDPKNKKKYAGHDEGWEFTEQVLEKVAKDKKLDYQKEEGEAAFYGPKLDFKIKDALGREWQCSTLQFDFNLPEKFDMSFINEKGEKERPYMLHRALFGSFERFIGLLIEHYVGAFPVWLAPTQVSIIPIATRHQKYAQQIAQELMEKNIRIEVKNNDETVGKKIRQAEMQKIPYMIIIGDKEIKTKSSVSVRDRKKGDLGQIKVKKFVEMILQQVEKRRL